MPLIEIKADLTRLAKIVEVGVNALERIAATLERMAPPVIVPSQPSTEEDFHEITYGGKDYQKPEDELWRDYAPRSNY